MERLLTLPCVNVITIGAEAESGLLTVTKKNAIPVGASFRGIVLNTIQTMTHFVADARMRWKMTDEITFTSNIRSKMARRERKWTATCGCGGLPHYQLKRCFRPGGHACARRAMRRHRRILE